MKEVSGNTARWSMTDTVVGKCLLDPHSYDIMEVLVVMLGRVF